MQLEEMSYIEAKQQIQAYVEKGRSKLKGDEKLRHDLAQATVYEYDHKRLPAASLFYNLSSKDNRYLERAIINALAASASEKRQALLINIYRDSRVQKSKWFNFIKKNVVGEVLSWNDIDAFCKDVNLNPQIFCEHIVIGLSRVFSNISISKLGLYCRMKEIQAYELLENMIINERLNGYIDQLDGYVHFNHKQSSTIEHFCTNLYGLLQ